MVNPTASSSPSTTLPKAKVTSTSAIPATSSSPSSTLPATSSSLGADHGQLDGSTAPKGNFRGTLFSQGILGIALGPQGNLFVGAGEDGQFYQFAQNGTFLTTEYFAQADPIGFAADSDENIYYANSGFIFKAANVVHRSESALLNHGLPSPEVLGPVTGQGSPTPTGLALDPATGELFAATPSAGVEHFAPSCEPRPQTENTPCAPLETFGAAELNHPEGLAVAAKSATVYVADTGHRRVAVFDAAPYLPAPAPTAAKPETPVTELLQGEVDPAGAGAITACHFQYAPRSAFANEVQVLGLSGATGGTFTLTFKGETTAPITYSPNENEEHIRIALKALPSVGGNLSVTAEMTPHGDPTGRFRIEFHGAFYQENVPQLTVDSSALLPHTASATIATEVQGGGGWSSATTVPCSSEQFSAPTEVSAEATGLTYATPYRYRLLATDATGASTSFAEPFTTLPEPPQIAAPSVEGTTAEGASVSTQINPGGGETSYRVQYLTSEQFEKEGGFSGPGLQQTPELDLGSARTPRAATVQLTGLQQATAYRFRFLATNASSPPGATTGPTAAFTTQPHPLALNDPCPNAHVRQQTSAASLLDCRAYELVSAANTAGYDVESNLIEGQTPFAGYPEAEGRVLYGVHDGGIPGTDHPTNRGIDPYLATRGPQGWTTEYVGVPSNDPGASGSPLLLGPLRGGRGT